MPPSRKLEINFQSGFRFLMMILIMGTNAAPFLMLDPGIYNPSGQLTEPKDIISKSSLLDLPLNLVYFSGYAAVYVFFFLSGYQSKQSLAKGLSHFLQSRYKNIYLPSLFFILIYFPIWILLYQENLFSGEQYFLEFLLMSFDISGSHVNSPMWFLSPLFASYAVAPIIYNIQTKIVTVKYINLLGLVHFILIVCCWLLGSRYDVIYPLHLILFFSLGILISHKYSLRTGETSIIQQSLMRHSIELASIIFSIFFANFYSN